MGAAHAVPPSVVSEHPRPALATAFVRVTPSAPLTVTLPSGELVVITSELTVVVDGRCFPVTAGNLVFNGTVGQIDITGFAEVHLAVNSSIESIAVHDRSNVRVSATTIAAVSTAGDAETRMHGTIGDVTTTGNAVNVYWPKN
jgi:hypothetical protein